VLVILRGIMPEEVSNTKESKQDAPVTFRLYPEVDLKWSEFNRDEYWNLSRALNVGLMKLMNCGDIEIEEILKKHPARKKKT